MFQQPNSDEYEAEVLEKVKLLVESSVDVNAVNNMGLTALDGAIDMGYSAVVTFLIESGAEEGAGLLPPG